jgi:hypothetical protein
VENISIAGICVPPRRKRVPVTFGNNRSAARKMKAC